MSEGGNKLLSRARGRRVRKANEAGRAINRERKKLNGVELWGGGRNCICGVIRPAGKWGKGQGAQKVKVV